MLSDLISQKIQDDLLYAKNTLIPQLVKSDNEHINKILSKSNLAKGKNLRALMVLLLCDIFKLHHNNNKPLVVASAMEIIHTATLLHDDVIDNADLRRGEKTINFIYTNKTSILAGDFLYARAFNIISQMNYHKLNQWFAHTTSELVSGELIQDANKITNLKAEEIYYEVIGKKTASLFGLCGKSAGLISGASNKQINILESYLVNIGNAFQIIDDILDITADPIISGKEIGNDILEQKATLPLIIAYKNFDDEIKNLLTNPKKINLPEIIKHIQNSNAILYSKNKAEEYCKASVKSISLIENDKNIKSSCIKCLKSIPSLLLSQIQ